MNRRIVKTCVTQSFFLIAGAKIDFEEEEAKKKVNQPIYSTKRTQPKVTKYSLVTMYSVDYLLVWWNKQINNNNNDNMRVVRNFF